MSPHQVQLSRWLSRHLRHAPEAIGLTLQPGGWADIGAVLEAARLRGLAATREELDAVVRDNDKLRFAIDPAGSLIRANQGHSVEVDLMLDPADPPDVLYHGTGRQTVPAILRDGLLKMNRHHVHLSADVPTATAVGKRHGVPVVFEVQAGRLAAAGVPFFRSANGVWLVEAVPPEYLRPRD